MDDDDVDGFGLAGVFVCEDYVEKTWRFNGEEQRLLCSNMSSTDHDLTGQIVWPASVLLTWFIKWWSDYGTISIDDCPVVPLSECNILELGAGCGLAGFFAANKCKSVHITDGNEVVIRLLQRNLEHLGLDASVGSLVWGMQQPIRDMLKRACVPHVTMGADVILWPQFTEPLLHTIRWLLRIRLYIDLCVSRDESVVAQPCAFISYVERATTTTDLFYSLCDTLGLSVSAVPKSRFIPSEAPEVTPDILKPDRYLFRIQLNTQQQAEVADLKTQYYQGGFAIDDAGVCESVIACEPLCCALLCAAVLSTDETMTAFMNQSEAPF